MDEKSIRTLEYHKVTSAVAGHCSFGASRELAETLHPYTSLDEVERAQSATSEARRLLELRPDISVKGARDIRSLVARADLGGMLEAPDFLPIASTVEAGRSLKRQVAKLQETTGELPLLRAVAGEMYGLDELHSSIRSSIGERGDVLDTASPALGRIRVELRRAHDRLQELLRSILTSSTYAQAIQEPIITLREGRYVIPVKADFRSRIPGIVPLHQDSRRIVRQRPPAELSTRTSVLIFLLRLTAPPPVTSRSRSGAARVRDHSRQLG